MVKLLLSERSINLDTITQVEYLSWYELLLPIKIYLRLLHLHDHTSLNIPLLVACGRGQLDITQYLITEHRLIDHHGECIQSASQFEYNEIVLLLLGSQHYTLDVLIPILSKFQGRLLQEALQIISNQYAGNLHKVSYILSELGTVQTFPKLNFNQLNHLIDDCQDMIRSGKNTSRLEAILEVARQQLIDYKNNSE